MSGSRKAQEASRLDGKSRRKDARGPAGGAIWRRAVRTETGILALSILTGVGLWVGDALVDALFFSHKPFLTILFSEVTPYEIYTRTTIFLSLILVGVVAFVLIRREKAFRKRLQESDARFQAFMDNLPGIAFMRDREGRYVFVNSGLCRTMGMTEDAVLGKGPQSLLQPHEAAQVLKEDATILGTGNPYQGEMVIRTVEGERTWMANKFPIPGPEGRPAMIGGVSVDITDLKRAEEALRESEDRYRTLFNNTNDGILLADGSGTIIGANAVQCERLGYSLEELTGMHVSQIDTPAFKDLVPERIRQIEDRGSSVFESEQMHRDGAPIPVEISARAVTYAGRPAILSTIRDISERKAADKALREAEELYRTLVENLGEGVGIVDEAETFVFANPVAEAIFGVDAGELAGKNLGEFMADPEYERAVEGTRLRRTGVTSSYESKIRRPDGEERLLRVTAAPREGDDGSFAGTLAVFSDVTDARRAEEELRVREERYRTILEDMEEGYYEVDLDGTITFANEALGRIWGIERDELVGRNFRSIMGKETADRAYTAFHRVFKTGRSEWIPDWQTVRADGSVRALEASAYPIAAAEGKYSGFRGVIRDVTQRLEAESALKESEARYRDLVENSVDVILTHDLKGRISSGNRAAARLFEVEDPRDILGLDLREVLAPEVKDEFEDYLEAVRRDGRAKGYMRILTKSGKEKMLAYENTLKPGDNGDGFVRARAQDVTENLAMESALKRSEERYRQLFERSLAGVYRSTMDGRLLECNHACARLLGFDSPEDAAGRATGPMYQDPETRRRLTESLRATGSVSNLEVALTRHDGSPFLALINATLVDDGAGGEVIEGSLIDLTEREALAREKARAHEFQSLAQLTSGIAHEVRNPLFAIQLNFAGVMRRLSLDEQTKAQMDYAALHLKRLESLVRSLLELGQTVQADELADVELGELVRSACAIVGQESPEQADTIRLDAPPVPVRVRVSPRKVTQAFVHLIRNAVQVTPEGGVVHIRCDHDASGCRVLITDQGPGIPGKIRDSLFEPFVTTRVGQPGMGLALARHYVESHGGTIEARDNEPPPGATFIVSLPSAGVAAGPGSGKVPLAGQAC